MIVLGLNLDPEIRQRYDAIAPLKRAKHGRKLTEAEMDAVCPPMPSVRTLRRLAGLTADGKRETQHGGSDGESRDGREKSDSGP